MGQNITVNGSRHFFQQPSKAFYRLSYMQAFFNRPDARGDGMNDGNLKIFFQ